jgi:hypothetical protein
LTDLGLESSVVRYFRWHYLGMSLFEFFEAQHDADVIGLIPSRIWSSVRKGDNRKNIATNQHGEILVMANKAKKTAKRRRRVEWSKAHLKELKAHSKAKTAVKKVAKAMKRTAGALRQKAHALGLALGHRR